MRAAVRDAGYAHDTWVISDTASIPGEGDLDPYDAVLWAHWIIGLLAFAAFPLHLVLGHRANALYVAGGAHKTQAVGTSAAALH